MSLLWYHGSEKNQQNDLASKKRLRFALILATLSSNLGCGAKTFCYISHSTILDDVITVHDVIIPSEDSIIPQNIVTKQNLGSFACPDHIFLKGSNFDDVITTYDVMVTSYPKWLFHLIDVMILYYHLKFGAPSTSRRHVLEVGVAATPPQS